MLPGNGSMSESHRKWWITLCQYGAQHSALSQTDHVTSQYLELTSAPVQLTTAMVTRYHSHHSQILATNIIGLKTKYVDHFYLYEFSIPGVIQRG